MFQKYSLTLDSLLGKAGEAAAGKIFLFDIMPSRYERNSQFKKARSLT